MAHSQIAYPTYRQPSVVRFGPGAIRALADEHSGATAFFLSGRETVRAAVVRAFEKRGLTLDPDQILTKPKGEPDRNMLQLGADFLSRRPFTCVAGIGGGSVMDWCRLSWALSAGALSLDDGRVEPRRVNGTRPEFWLVPTTCATGAEAACVAVFSDGGRKIPVASPIFVADGVILDGQFLNAVGRRDLACFLSDALSHAIEAYVSIVPGTLAKEAAVSALTLILEHWTQDPSSCRSQRLMEAAYLGGVAASNCSVGVVHAFAHTVAAYDIGHGHAIASGLIAGLEINGDVPAMAQLLTRCGLYHIDQLIDRVRSIVTSALPPDQTARLRCILLDAGHRRDISARMSTDVCLRSNPRLLDLSDLQRFLDSVVRQLA